MTVMVVIAPMILVMIVAFRVVLREPTPLPSLTYGCPDLIPRGEDQRDEQDIAKLPNLLAKER